MSIVVVNLSPVYFFFITYDMTTLIFVVLLLHGDQNNNNRLKDQRQRMTLRGCKDGMK